ncbi:MAG TPA: glucose 1-dehydrogenase [Acidimicrobiales bacterium]|jgi:3alpha(or 20beta)-hydroxysteroid dehydrogenase|nr:glucose 1-dehydrogenase [Acidimicrobiales bacterium]
MGRLDGRVALVTGAARGQGAAEARAFVDEGARVVFTDVLDDAGRALAADLGAAAAYEHLDVTSEDDWRRVVEGTVARFGALHVLVNNAGISPTPAPIVDTSVDAYRRVIETNLVSMFTGIHCVAPKIVDSGGGSIVNVSSVNGFAGAAGIAGYVSSKFGVRGLTRTAALELGRFGVRVNSIHPGPIDTPMVQPESWGGFDMRPILASKMPLGRIGQPDEVAELVVWLSSDASGYCTGAEFVIDGGYLAGPVDPVGRGAR